MEGFTALPRPWGDLPRHPRLGGTRRAALTLQGIILVAWRPVGGARVRAVFAQPWYIYIYVYTYIYMYMYVCVCIPTL